MLAFTLPGVTPPLVNTGLEVSSVDKNTLASQQREKSQNSSLICAYCARRASKVSLNIHLKCFIFGADLQCYVKFKHTKVECHKVRFIEVISNSCQCLHYSIFNTWWNLFGNVENCVLNSQELFFLFFSFVLQELPYFTTCDIIIIVITMHKSAISWKRPPTDKYRC